MIIRVNQVPTTRAVATKIVTIEYLIGLDAIGPSQCIHCHRLFVEGELWLRVTAPPDPEFGTYSIGVHDGCSVGWPIR
jgi:hypothetical protein